MADENKAGAVPLPARVVVSLRAGAVLAVANVVCVVIFSYAWTRVKAEPKQIAVTGSAKRVIESDLIVWSAHVSAEGDTLPTAYAGLKASVDKTVAYLTGRGIDAKAITAGSIRTTKHFDRDARGNPTDKVLGYELSQSVTVTGGDVDRVAGAARTVTDLIEQGVLLESDPPQYVYTKLADLKVSMLAEATADATARAKQIAVNSGATLGTIADARMGVMQINPVHGDDATGSGVSDTTSREKEITAVVSARFGLR